MSPHAVGGLTPADPSLVDLCDRLRTEGSLLATEAADRIEALDKQQETLAQEFDKLTVDIHYVTTSPIPMLLWCPECSNRHVDQGAFATKVHHTHACQVCGHCWRPAVRPTCGVQFLPGFKDPEP